MNARSIVFAGSTVAVLATVETAFVAAESKERALRALGVRLEGRYGPGCVAALSSMGRAQPLDCRVGGIVVGYAVLIPSDRGKGLVVKSHALGLSGPSSSPVKIVADVFSGEGRLLGTTVEKPCSPPTPKTGAPCEYHQYLPSGASLPLLIALRTDSPYFR